MFVNYFCGPLYFFQKPSKGIVKSRHTLSRGQRLVMAAVGSHHSSCNAQTASVKGVSSTV